MDTSRQLSKPPSVPAHSLHAVAAGKTPHYAQEAMRHTSAQQDCPFVGERMIEFDSLARQCGIAPGMLKMLDLSENEAGMLRDLQTTLDEMGRLLDGLAFEIERCVPADGPHGALSSQIIGLLRQ
jgi:hypothetical protein